MLAIERSSPYGRTRTYRSGVDEIAWRGRRINAFVIDGVPLEGGLIASERVASIAANRLLAERPELSNAEWAVFVKTRAGMPVPEWQIIGSGVGREALSKGDPVPTDIPEEVLHQLKQIPLV